VSRQIRSEWLKATSTRMWWILIVAGVLLVGLNVASIILLSGQSGLSSLEDTATMRQLWATLGSASVIALVLGIVSITGEFRHHTITNSFLTEPRRLRFLFAKGTVQAVLGILLALISAAVGLALAMALLPFHDHAPVDFSQVGQVVAGAALCYALYSVLGLAIGSLITNQVVAILVTLLWVVLIESLVVGLLPQIGKWLPGGAAASILQGTSVDGENLLPVWLGALVLLGYAVVLGAIAARTTLRRDIT
jgi:hypothetical protein